MSYPVRGRPPCYIALSSAKDLHQRNNLESRPGGVVTTTISNLYLATTSQQPPGRYMSQVVTMLQDSHESEPQLTLSSNTINIVP